MINIKVFEDIGFVAIGFPRGYLANFKVYKLCGITSPDGQLVFTKDSDAVYEITEAELYLDGNVRWDGCSNWHFDEQDRCCIHGCDRDDLTAIGEIMARCWDWAADLCIQWDPC